MLLVTLILSVHSRESIWLLADRRLSFGRARPPIDDAMKIVELRTEDGVGLIAYAGLGATSRGTQPSEWISAVLRGRGGLGFERTLGLLSDASNAQLPRHLYSTPGGQHFIVIPAFVRGIGRRFYSIDNVVERSTRRHWYRFTSWQTDSNPGSPAPRVGLAGSGGMYLLSKRNDWMRPLFRLVKAHDKGRASDLAVANYLAGLNHDAHHAVTDGTVGPRAVVAWRRRLDGRQDRSAGGHQFYLGNEYDRAPQTIPAIVNGLDLQAIVNIMTQGLQPHFEAFRATGYTEFNPDLTEIDRRISSLPSDPDEKLR
ncbi:hypothetical protein SAMN05421748_114130 [Paractinoplanes atraurantiacus]|uniref:Uncharacterized protein n=1 Tax=Paractinoplanes atraurantiacus TaxID=1036182 RepID=A0A285J0B1_9ACTN|nr:hypothetical protein SAMN05421748_114130 [Actinoplanes atraurantiacus]